jgi:hypothetical protein
MEMHGRAHIRIFTCSIETSKPTCRLKGVIVDLDGVRTKANFEVIEIVDGTTPYLVLLGLDWTFEN